MVKLMDGGQLLRFTDATSGLSVERRVDAARSGNEQKKQLGEVFKAAVARAQLALVDFAATGRADATPLLSAAIESEIGKSP